jgi:hypothetical protein
VGLRSFFIRRRTPVTEDSSPAAVAAPKEEREPLTPARLADLRKAWAELNQAAADAGVNTFRASRVTEALGRTTLRRCAAWRP